MMRVKYSLISFKKFKNILVPSRIAYCRSDEGANVPIFDGPISLSNAESGNDASRCFVVSLYRIFRVFLCFKIY